MNIAIVAYPDLDEIDRQWIESFRAKHDPQASRLGVHFTLVFPVEAVPGELDPEVAVVARSTAAISFAIRRTAVVRDALAKGSHIVLVPDEGGAQITSLHDRLYAGGLRAQLRADIPFVPHLTVGATQDSESAERLARELGVRTRLVRGTVRTLALVDVGTPRVQSLTTYVLAGGPPAT